MTELAELWLIDGWRRFLFDAAWQSTLIGAIALAVLHFVRMRPAARAAVALGAIVLCVATPIASSTSISRHSYSNQGGMP